MATAATSLLGLALPVTGELSGTWGDTVNVSITALLDTAVAGTTTLSSDADVTLTTTTLAANQARQAIILWTAGGTATRTITVPAQSKSYIVINKTSSSQSIKIVGAGPTTGVTIVAGTAAFVVWNGVDFVTASVTSTTGVLPVANGGTGLASGTSGGVLAYTATGTLASSTALAASALVIGGGAGAAPSTTTTGTGVVTALGVNTGTAGAFVVNGGALGSPSTAGTMPAFTLGGTVSGGGNQINNVVIGTTTPLAGNFTTLTTSSTVTINGGTANGVGYLDGSKVLTTGSALTFDGTTFGVNAAFGTSTAAVTLKNSTAASISNIVEQQYFAANTFGGVEQIAAIRATNPNAGGNNGGFISVRVSANGTATTPSEVLGVSSTGLAVTGALSATSTNAAGGTGLSITNLGDGSSLTPYAFVNFSTGSDDGASSIRSYRTASGTDFQTRLDFLVNPTGATHTPISAFYVESNGAGGTRANVTGTLSGGTSGTGYSFSGSAPATSLTLDSSGRLGVGTASPTFGVDVQNTGALTAALSATRFTTAGATSYLYLSASRSATVGVNTALQSGDGMGIVRFSGADGTTYKSSADIRGYVDGAVSTGVVPGRLSFWTNSNGTLNETMRLDSAGNLGLGVTPSAWGSSYRAFETASAGLMSNTNGGSFFLMNNAYYNGTNWIYKYTSAASRYDQSGGTHAWFNAASGTAGDPITFTQAMTLDTSGNLLVGGTSNALGSRVLVENAAGNQLALRYTGVATYYNSVDSGGNLIWTKDGTERARIDSSGNLLVGTTSQASNERVSIVTGATEGYRVKTTGGSGAAAGVIHNATTSGDNVFLDFGTEASYTSRGSITYNRAGGLVAYNVTSDYRAKDISGPVTGSGALIDSVPVYMGKMKDATQERPMFIAHEVPAYAHTGEKDAVDKDGKPVYQQMDASALIPVMWAEIQSLRTRLAALEAK